MDQHNTSWRRREAVALSSVSTSSVRAPKLSYTLGQRGTTKLHNTPEQRPYLGIDGSLPVHCSCTFGHSRFIEKLWRPAFAAVSVVADGRPNDPEGLRVIFTTPCCCTAGRT